MNRLGISLVALVLACGLASVVEADALHGFCVSPTPTCSDNGAITPVNSSLPTFGFGNAGGTLLGTDQLAFLIPNNKDGSPSFSFTVNVKNGGPTDSTNTSALATLFSLTQWSSGQLDAYLGLNASPTNPIGAYVPGPGCNGGPNPCDLGVASYFVYVATFVNTLVQPQNNELNGPIFSLSGLPGSLNGQLPLGSFILDFLTPATGGGTIGTPNSAALEISATPEPGTLALFGAGLVGIAGVIRRRLGR
jgi:hypothetical protein